MASSKLAHRTFLAALALLAGATFASAQTSKPNNATTDDTRDANLRAYVQLLRSDLRTEKVAIITEVMAFTEEEDAKFWPIYREYETKLANLNDERLKGIKEYADNFDKVTDELADRLVRGALGLEERRNTLKLDVYNKVKTALSAKTAARFLQVENQILLLLDLQIASSLPIVQ
jgi:hypothetical protein